VCLITQAITELQISVRELEAAARAIRTDSNKLQDAHAALGTIPKRIEELNASTQNLEDAVRSEFAIITDRERSWLSAPYPRLILVDVGRRRPKVDRQDRRLTLTWKGPLRIHLRCEHDGCEYRNERPYELDLPLRIIGTVLSEKKNVEISEISLALIEGGTHDYALKLAAPFIHGLAGSWAIVKFPTLSALMFASGIWPEVVPAAVGVAWGAFGLATAKLIISLHEEIVDRRSLEPLFDDLTTAMHGAPTSLMDLGGPMHQEFGLLIDQKDQREKRRRYGGLTRVLGVDGIYRWVCPKHEAEPQYRLRLNGRKVSAGPAT
jgi:hypothetical protein